MGRNLETARSMDTTEKDFFGKERIGRILLKMAPPVMLAQLIQALYNIVDSFFVGKYSENALTALTVIYPLQLIIIALAVGTGDMGCVCSCCSVDYETICYAVG